VDIENFKKKELQQQPNSEDIGVPGSHDSLRPDHLIDIPVVGMGGSAGALLPFESFFTSMSSDSGAAFVVIQHMSPDHESLLPELLARHTRMPVAQAENGMQVEANRVYIVPPIHHLGLRNGHFYFTEPVKKSDARMQIDFFFHSLAEDRAEKAICILFSGAGSDGVFGAKMIRAAGGLVIAQDPDTAQFRDIPEGAKNAGVVDYVLPAERMSEAVLQYIRHPYMDRNKKGLVLDAQAKPGDVQDILTLVLNQTGCDFTTYKKSTVLRRIERRMGLRQISSLAEYSGLVHEDAYEVRQLLKDLLIKVTAFFRDPQAWDELLDKAVAPLIEEKSSGEAIRIWVPGCASGEEAYSLAILITEQLAKAGKDCVLQVFATDADEEALEVARRGLYPDRIAADLSPERLNKFFVRREPGYQVNDSLRKTVIFATHNLLANPPFSKVDIISCRNLLIYLETEAQTKLMALFNFALKPGGYLFLGRSETVVGQDNLFETVSNRGRIHRRLESIRSFVLDSPVLPGRARPTAAASAPIKSSGSVFADALRLEILKHFDASAVLINRKGQILQFHGNTDKYLNLPATGPSFNILELAKGRLAPKLRPAINKAVLDGKSILLHNVAIAAEGSLFARVTVAPVSQKGEGEPLLAVFFEDIERPPAAKMDPNQPEGSGTLIIRLEEELRVTERDLQTTIAELQSTNEQLRAANEETNSANEELQLTNEEMVSSTEELQSTNEELTTVNSQLQEKIALLDTANTDMTNLLKSSQVAALFLDRELRIKFFTPAVTRILNMSFSDVGSPLAALTSDFINYDLAADAASVAQRDSEVEREVRRSNGSAYLMHLIPYYNQEGRPDGVIATFSDITRLRRVEKQLAVIVESSNDAIYSKTTDGIILTWNRAAEAMYGYSAEESIGKNVSMLIPADRPNETMQILERIRRGEITTLFETERVTKGGRTIRVSLSVSPIKDSSGHITGASAIARDITEQKGAEEALERSEERFRTLVESSPYALLLVDADGKIGLLNRRADEMIGYAREELLGQSIEILVPERFRRQHSSYRVEFASKPEQTSHGCRARSVCSSQGWRGVSGGNRIDSHQHAWGPNYSSHSCRHYRTETSREKWIGVKSRNRYEVAHLQRSILF
jgi:two-component system, chemotaxis family, CheB/CheR fusion protein